MLEALDNGNTSILVVLHLYAVFDTINHQIMLNNRLSQTYGIYITGKALSGWNRTKVIDIKL